MLASDRRADRGVRRLAPEGAREALLRFAMQSRDFDREKRVTCSRNPSRTIDMAVKKSRPPSRASSASAPSKNRRTRHASGHHRALSQLERVTHVVVGEFSPHEGSDSNDATTILALGVVTHVGLFVTHVGGYANMRSKIEMGALSSVRRVRRATSVAGSDHVRRRKPG